MNLRQQRFVAAYLETGNASEASRRAGYKTDADVQGARLMGNASIRAAIEAARAKAAEEAKISQAWLIERQRAILDHACNDLDAMGSVANKALHQLAVLTGHWVERRNTTTSREPRDLSDDELIEAIANERASARRA
jgi:Terminase small subunit